MAILLTIIISYLRISDGLHNFDQIGRGLLLGLVIGYCILKGTIYSKKLTILFLTFIALISLYLYIKIISKTYLELKNIKEDVPVWFDPNLISLYKKKIDINSKVGLRNILFRCFFLKTPTRSALPHTLTWQQIMVSLDKKSLGEFKPDIIVGIKSGGAFITKYIAEKYKLPYYYINIKNTVIKIFLN